VYQLEMIRIIIEIINNIEAVFSVFVIFSPLFINVILRGLARKISWDVLPL